jgi:hypothetical protein
MRRALIGFSCAADVDSIFVCGGTNIDGRGTRLIDVLSFGSTTPQRWSLFASMAAPRTSCASAVVDGRLYVLGGIGNTPLRPSTILAV